MYEDELDHTPLTFGKYKGKTPDEISNTREGESYIVWMFETVDNKPTCSRLLYEACGGKPLKSPQNSPNDDEDIGDFDDDIPF